MAAHTPTRRAVLGAIPALATVPALAAPAGATAAQNVSPELSALFDKVRANNAAAKLAHDTFVPALEAYKAELVGAVAAVPHVRVDAGESITGGRVVWTTEKPHQTSEYVTKLGTIAADSTADCAEYVAGCREFVRRAGEREAAIEAIKSRLAAKHRVDELRDESNRLGDVGLAIDEEIARFPVAGLADFCAKVEHMAAQDMFEWDEVPDLILADVRRLCGTEG